MTCIDLFSNNVSFDDFLASSELGLQTFGAQFLERLHVLHQLDSLMHINGSNSSDIDLQQSVVHLNTLAGMLLTQPSKLSLARVLATGDYLKPLYPYLTLLQSDESPDSAPLKIACYGYAVEMLSVAVRLDGNAQFLENHAERICSIIEVEDARETVPLEESIKLIELMPWLMPARKPESFSYDNIHHIVDMVKDQLEHVDKFPGELFTALRMLKNMAIPPHEGSESTSAIFTSAVAAAGDESGASDDVIQELKYKYAVVQMFYADLASHLNNLLTKVCSLFPQPGLHSSQLSAIEGCYLIHLLEPALALLYCLLKHVIQVQSSSFGSWLFYMRAPRILF